MTARWAYFLLKVNRCNWHPVASINKT